MKEGVKHSIINWDIIKKSLQELYNKDNLTFNNLYKSLKNRKSFAIKKVGNLFYRKELTQFIEIMELI